MLTGAAVAQPAPRVVVEAGGVSQSYSTGDERSLSQFTLPVSAAAEVTPGVTLGLRAVYASVSGDGLEGMSGLGDTQLSVGYRRALGDAVVDLTLASSLPTGQTGLTDAQFATTAALAIDDYAFALPTLGQGAVISPGVAIAIPAGDAVAIGFGAAYSARSSYTLFADDTSAYAPGDETILTAALQTGSGASSFKLEGSYVLYGDDGYRGQTFSPGDKAAATLRLTLGGRYVRSQIQARYRHVFDGTVGTAERAVSYLRPSQAQLGLGLGVGPPETEVMLTAGARYYGSISDVAGAVTVVEEVAGVLAEQQVLLDLGVAPTIALGPSARLRGQFVYTLGVAEAAGASPLTGYRAGASVRVGF